MTARYANCVACLAGVDAGQSTGGTAGNTGIPARVANRHAGARTLQLGGPWRGSRHDIFRLPNGKKAVAGGRWARRRAIGDVAGGRLVGLIEGFAGGARSRTLRFGWDWVVDSPVGHADHRAVGQRLQLIAMGERDPPFLGVGPLFKRLPGGVVGHPCGPALTPLVDVALWVELRGLALFVVDAALLNHARRRAARAEYERCVREYVCRARSRVDCSTVGHEPHQIKR